MDSFHTDSGLRVPAVAEPQMREIDRVAVEELGPNLHQMMENAGRSLASVCMTMLGERGAGRPVPARGLGESAPDRRSCSTTRPLPGSPTVGSTTRETSARSSQPCRWTPCWATASRAPRGVADDRSGGCRTQRPRWWHSTFPRGSMPRPVTPGEPYSRDHYGDPCTSQDWPPRRCGRRAVGGRHRHPARRL